MLGRVCEVVQVRSDEVLRVKADKMEWTVNVACCKLAGQLAPAAANKTAEIEKESDSSSESDVDSGKFCS